MIIIKTTREIYTEDPWANNEISEVKVFADDDIYGVEKYLSLHVNDEYEISKI